MRKVEEEYQRVRSVGGVVGEVGGGVGEVFGE